MELNELDINTDDETVIAVSTDTLPNQYLDRVEVLLGSRGHDQVQLAGRNDAVLTAIRVMNILRRQDDLAFDLEFEYEIGQSRVEHHNEDKDWYYRDDILITITKLDDETADDGGDG